MTIGEKIQRLRKARGLSQEALARMMYVTRQTISKWELGQSAPDLALIARLSDIFQVSADYLIKDDAGTDTVPPASKPSRSSPARLRRLLWASLSGALLAAFLLLTAQEAAALWLDWRNVRCSSCGKHLPLFGDMDRCAACKTAFPA